MLVLDELAGLARRASTAGAARKAVEGIQAGLDPDGVAVFQLSGGTTGVPKVIPRLHAEYWYNAAAYARSWGWTPDTRVAHLIPIIHNAGIVCARPRAAQRRRVPGARHRRPRRSRCR